MLWFFYALGAAIIWGINYAVSGRLLERGMSPPDAVLYRHVFWHDCPGAFDQCDRKMAGHASGNPQCATTASLSHHRGNSASPDAGLLIFMSIEAKNATVASLIEVSYPLFTAFFAWVLFRQNTVSSFTTIIGALLILLGVVIVARGNR